MNTHRNRAPARDSNAPVVAIVCATILLLAALVAVVLAPDTSRELQLLVGAVLTTVPSLGAVWFAERASRDIRNGTVEDKARTGARKALEETGVTEVVEASARGEASVLAMQALGALLARDREHDKAAAKVAEDEPGGPS